MITQPESLLDAIERVRREAPALTSNLFASREQIGRWVERRTLSAIESERGLLVVRADRDFQRVYHVAADQKALAASLESLMKQAAGPVLVTDVVGTAEFAGQTAATYEEHGFSRYTSLNRMVRLGGELSSGHDYGTVSPAGAGDLPETVAFLDRVLDPWRDQIPETEDIFEAAARGNILVERSGDRLRGVLYFEDSGLSSTLQYWYVDRSDHNLGVGGRLIRRYLDHCRDKKRILLWVVRDNLDAIAKYRHYGFRDDNLVDHIMIQKRSA